MNYKSQPKETHFDCNGKKVAVNQFTLYLGKEPSLVYVPGVLVKEESRLGRPKAPNDESRCRLVTVDVSLL